jgi:hypothetical protein
VQLVQLDQPGLQVLRAIQVALQEQRVQLAQLVLLVPQGLVLLVQPAQLVLLDLQEEQPAQLVRSVQLVLPE